MAILWYRNIRTYAYQSIGIVRHRHRHNKIYNSILTLRAQAY